MKNHEEPAIDGGVMNVEREALDNTSVRVLQGMHTEAHLTDDVGDVGPRQGKILECPGDSAIERGFWEVDPAAGVAGTLGLP